MALVQVDQSVIDDSATKIEALVGAVTDFLAHPQVQQLPAAVTDSLTQALTDASNAQQALVSASQPPATP